LPTIREPGATRPSPHSGHTAHSQRRAAASVACLSTRAFSSFFAVLAVACWAGTALLIALALARRRHRGAADLYEDVSRVALWIATLVALVTTAGSLYYSEVAHFVPCKLCWYQRIAAYPLAILLLVAAIRRDRRVWLYVVPLALVGAGFSIYHAQLQAFPDQGSSFCTVTEPCTARYVWEWKFISLPLMALSAFVIIITLVLVARSAVEREDAST
jgi:disulfide bond formation protein DsbB